MIRLRHMLDAAREALAFAQGKTEHSIGDDRQLALSLVKEIEIIGEAASKVSEPPHTQLPLIPWLDIVEMRIHLIHAYFDVDVGVVWDTVWKDIPPLISALDAALTSAQ